MQPDKWFGTAGELWTLRLAPWVVLVLIVAFIGSAAEPRFETLMEYRPMLLGGALVISGIWFIACFTGDADLKLRHAFVFAYAFTFGAFALLVTPFVGSDVAPNQSVSTPLPAADAITTANKAAAIPPVGVLQLIRGCITKDAGGIAQQVSVVAACPVPGWTQAPAGAASAPAAPVRAASAPEIYKEVGHQYAWLVSIGGVTAKRYSYESRDSSGQVPSTHIEVHGGLAVPLYVIVLAFMGGAISLSRRIPEYQRRAEVGYVPTEKEPALLSFQAREHVVFQIMQLASAPFLAMATWYMITPATQASAATLAFGTGFASEPLLLMIRGMVEGIRPEGARPLAARTGELKGIVVRGPAKDRVANATVTVEWVDSKEARTISANDKGEFSFGAVRPGKVNIWAVDPKAPVGGERAERSLLLDERTSGMLEVAL